MDIKEIKEIIKLLKGTDVSEIELEHSNKKIRIKRAIENVNAQGGQKSVPVIVEQTQEALPPATAKSPSDAYKTVTSPMVGTFYSAASPESSPFVRVGDVVKKGQILCIIEAMKLMNEIEAEINGKIASVLIENAQPVEYGEPMFLIDPA